MTTKTGFAQEVPQELIRLAKDGDYDAFEQIYKIYADASYNLALRYCGQSATAQDVVHEAFIKLINRIDSYRGDGSFAGWLRRIVTHEAINRIRANSRIHLVGEDELVTSESPNLFDQNWLEACRDLDKLTGQLSETARAVLYLHEVEGYSHKEIADLFDKSESFSKVTLSRAYSALKKMVESAQLEQHNAFK